MRKFLAFFLLLTIVTITGCSNYEKDISVDTDLYGSFSKHIEATNVSYSENTNYTFYDNNKYKYLCKEVIDGVITKDINKNGKILSVEEISDDISKITLDSEVVMWSMQETSNVTVYKYKNMLGDLFETTVPDGKTFDLKLDELAFWFDKEGQYHLCIDTSACDCKTNCPQYTRKDDIVYFQSMDEEHKNRYTIGAYIVDKGLFFPKLYKNEN